MPKALDAICLKAMAHRKEDRYQTAHELADDIQRFVAGEPVSAYPEGFAARAWRWAKRHRKVLGRVGGGRPVRRGGGLRGHPGPRRRAAPRPGRSRLEGARSRRGRDLKEFRHLADEASFFAATTNPASEHAPYFDPAERCGPGAGRPRAGRRGDPTSKRCRCPRSARRSSPSSTAC